MTRSNFYPGRDGLEQVLRHKNAEIELRRKIRELESNQLNREAAKVASNNQDTTGELLAGGLFFLWVAGMIVTVVLNFVFNWNIFWPIIGIGVGIAGVITALAFAVGLFISAWRTSRRTRL